MAEVKIFVFVSVGKDWVPAGLLKCSIENNSVVGSRFRYGARYLKRKDALSVDLASLPLRDEEFVTEPNHQVFSGILDSAPDSWGRALMEKMADRPLREDEFLMATSDYRVGALAFSKSLATVKRETPWPIEREVPDIIDLEAVMQSYLKLNATDHRQIAKALSRYIQPGSPLGGARPKAVVQYGGKLWVAKFQRDNDPFDFVRSEYACLRLAKICGLNVPEIKIEKVLGKSVFLIKRFDREQGLRWHLNSFFSILKESELSFMHSSYMDIADALVKYSQNDRADRRELFKRMVFNGLCRNTDDHLRNHAMLYNPNTKAFGLSPLYDVVCDVTAPPDFKLAIGCGLDPQGLTTRAFSRANVIHSSPAFGLHQEEAKVLYDAMAKLVQRRWQEVFRSAGFSAREFALFGKVFGE